MEIARIMLLQILTPCPAPAAPQCTIFLPIFSSTGFAAANAFSSPPHMKVSVAPLAPPVPPETGASTEATPCFTASACASLALSTSMVEQSMISVPLVMAGTTSFQTESTCLPAGSIVITTSAPFTDDAALSAIAAPSAPAWLREASTRSNATTLWPALTRLAAMGPPILPRPMNAIVVIWYSSAAFLFVLLEPEFVGADFGKVRGDEVRCHVLNSRRRPPGIAILVDDCSAHTLAEIVAPKHFQRRTILPHQALFQRRRTARQPQQPQGHHHTAWRFLHQRLQCRLCEFRAVALEGGDDILHPVVAEEPIDLGLPCRDGPGLLSRGKAVDQRPDLARRRARPHPCQCFAQGPQLHRGHHRIGKTCVDRVGPIHGCPGQAEIGADLARRTRQEIRAADVGEEAEADLGHRQFHALGDDTMAGMC